MNDLAIQVKHLSKMYKLYNKPSDRLREALGIKVQVKEHYALNDVSFDVKKRRNRWNHRDQWIGEIHHSEDHYRCIESYRRQCRGGWTHFCASGAGSRL